jgi:hypothetical protein
VPAQVQSYRHPAGSGRWATSGATPHPNSTDNTGQRRPLNIAVQEPVAASIAGRLTTPVLSDTEEAMSLDFEV